MPWRRVVCSLTGGRPGDTYLPWEGHLGIDRCTYEAGQVTTYSITRLGKIPLCLGLPVGTVQYMGGVHKRRPFLASSPPSDVQNLTGVVHLASLVMGIFSTHRLPTCVPRPLFPPFSSSSAVQQTAWTNMRSKLFSHRTPGTGV